MRTIHKTSTCKVHVPSTHIDDNADTRTAILRRGERGGVFFLSGKKMHIKRPILVSAV